jgi:hypothetical protein
MGSPSSSSTTTPRATNRASKAAAGSIHPDLVRRRPDEPRRLRGAGLERNAGRVEQRSYVAAARRDGERAQVQHPVGAALLRTDDDPVAGHDESVDGLHHAERQQLHRLVAPAQLCELRVGERLGVVPAARDGDETQPEATSSHGITMPASTTSFNAEPSAREWILPDSRVSEKFTTSRRRLQNARRLLAYSAKDPAKLGLANDCPNPGRSGAITRWCSRRARMTRTKPSDVTGAPWTRTTGGPSPSSTGDVAAVYRDPADAQTQRRGAAHRLTRAARWLHVHGTGYATET